MRLQLKVFLGLLVVLLVTFSLVEYKHYSNTKSEIIDEIQYDARNIRSILMSVRRVYHHQFLESGLPLTDNTLGFLPASSMSRISQDFQNWSVNDIYFNNVSDRPRNPKNAADSIEKEAITFFSKNPSERERFVSYKSEEGKMFYHFSTPIWVEEYCLKCHGKRDDAHITIRTNYYDAYDYKVGEIRGIMSIKIPAYPLETLAWDSYSSDFWFELGGLLSALFLIAFLLKRYIFVPLSKINNGLSAVSEGKFDYLVEELPGEMGAVSRSFNQMGKRLNLITVSRNELDKEINERKQFETELRESKERLQTITTAAKDAIIMIDNESIITFWNDASEVIFGYLKEDAVGKSLASLIIPKEFREAHMTGFKKFKDTGQGSVVGKTVRLTAFRKDGTEFPISLSLSSVMIKGKWNAIGIVRDITERKLIEERLEESEDKFRSISDSANDAIIMLGNDEKIYYWNKSAESIFGYSRDEVEGKDICELIIPERFREKHLEGFERFKSIGTGNLIGKTVEVSGIRKDGSEIPIELSLSSVQLKGKWCAIGLIRDISERKRAERRLNAQHAVTQILSESNTLKEASKKILQAICESLSWEFGALWFCHRQDNVLRCSELWHIPGNEVLEFKEKTREISFAPEIGLPGRVWASGKPAWIVDVVEDPNFPRAHVALKAGLHAAFGFPVIVNEEVLGTLEFFSHDKEEPDNDLLNMMAAIGSQIGLFIKRKQTEKELRESHKMMSVGRLTASVFHEVLNPINIISSHTQLLLMEAEKGSRTEEDLQSIQGEIDRIVKITDDLRTISSDEEGEVVEVEINGLLENTLNLIRPELNIKSIKAVLKLEKELPEVMAHESEIGQAFINIVSNAIEAMPDGGTLTIITQCEQKKGLPLVRIKIIDTGCGIAKNIMDKIFEPFFSTKKEIKGVGLGLSSSYNIINGCGGKLSVESEEGNGTTFIIDLPINI
jgi:PAS domain S-box-containing protein